MPRNYTEAFNQNEGKMERIVEYNEFTVRLSPPFILFNNFNGLCHFSTVPGEPRGQAVEEEFRNWPAQTSHWPTGHDHTSMNPARQVECARSSESEQH
jgi:hypothetical protein